MTLNDFVAYIQFLAAFYISLGFEKLVDKIFLVIPIVEMWRVCWLISKSSLI